MAFSGVHHIALSTNNMKAQLEFFTQAVGMRLVGLHPMHGVEGASHAFIEAGKDSYLSFVEMDGVSIDPVIGLSHARDVAGPVAGGAMQHIAFNLDTLEEMYDLRDRLRSHKYMVFGPLNHESCHSMYLAGPEGILLEFSTNEISGGFTPEMWVEPATATHVGASPEELARYISPPAFAGQGGKVLQPDVREAAYPTPIPREMFDAVSHLGDEEIAAVVTFPPAPGAAVANRVAA